MSDRRRNLFVLLAVLGLIAASLAVITTKETKLGLDLQGGVQLIYEGKPTKQQPTVTAEGLDRALDIMRDRVDALGVAEPELQRSGANQIDVSLPGVEGAEDAERQVGTTAQMYFYDWEPNILDEDCRTNPESVNGGQQPISGLYNAVKRASRCPRASSSCATRTGASPSSSAARSTTGGSSRTTRSSAAPTSRTRSRTSRTAPAERPSSRWSSPTRAARRSRTPRARSRSAAPTTPRSTAACRTRSAPRTTSRSGSTTS